MSVVGSGTGSMQQAEQQLPKASGDKDCQRLRCCMQLRHNGRRQRLTTQRRP